MSKPTFNTPTTTKVEPIQVIAGILQSEMSLTTAQIAFAYQKYFIPNDGLFVLVGYLGPSEQVASQTYFDDLTLNEVQESVFKHTIQIEIMSMAPDNSARIRKEEIALALRSFYSQQQQDANFLGLAWLQSDFVDATSFEDSAMLNRYITTCAVNALHRKVKASKYFNNFPLQLTVASPNGASPTVNINTATAPLGH